MADIEEDATVSPPGVEHLSGRRLVIVSISNVRLEQHTTASEAFRHLQRSPRFGCTQLEPGGQSCLQWARRLGAACTDRDQPPIASDRTQQSPGRARCRLSSTIWGSRNVAPGPARRSDANGHHRSGGACALLPVPAPPGPQHRPSDTWPTPGTPTTALITWRGRALDPLTGNQGHRCRRRRLDTGSCAQHRHALVSHRFRFDDDIRDKALNRYRLRDMAARKHENDLNRNRNERWPPELSVGISSHRSCLANDDD